LEKGYTENKYGALYAKGYNEHLINLSIDESAAYYIFLKHQYWQKEFGALLLSQSGEGNTENKNKNPSSKKSPPQKERRQNKQTKVAKANMTLTSKWTLASLEQTFGATKNKATSDGWLSQI
jgi:hypothetical protein